MTQKNDDHTNDDKIIELTDTLSGAFADGVDLGPRETQIRSIGESLEISLQYLRTALANININPDSDDMSTHLDKIALLARLAANYRVD